MTTSKTRILMPLTLALAALGLMVAAQIAGATHARPKGASPLRVPLVPAYNACGTPNRMGRHSRSRPAIRRYRARAS